MGRGTLTPVGRNPEQIQDSWRSKVICCFDQLGAKKEAAALTAVHTERLLIENGSASLWIRGGETPDKSLTHLLHHVFDELIGLL